MQGVILYSQIDKTVSELIQRYSLKRMTTLPLTNDSIVVITHGYQLQGMRRIPILSHVNYAVMLLTGIRGQDEREDERADTKLMNVLTVRNGMEGQRVRDG